MRGPHCAPGNEITVRYLFRGSSKPLESIIKHTAIATTHGSALLSLSDTSYRTTMKVAGICLLVVLVAAVTVEGFAFQNQSRIIGNVRPGDRLLDRQSAFKVGKANMVQVANYIYPKFGTGGLISCIKVLDRYLNGTNGALFINSGGVGGRSVSMSIRSIKGFGINYDIETYGR